jgi:16S rRNA (adenine1518-N6/adenine1519-N6)-dimethyltransferase
MSRGTEKPTELLPLDVRGLLRKFDLRPKKPLGQNFLINPAALKRVVSVAEISDRDEVLEVGAGVGGLTRQLAVIASGVVAVELDRRLVPPLMEVVAPFPNVRVVEGDILSLAPGDLIRQPGYLVVSNIPYYITSPLIRHLLEATVRPRCLVLTVQREVAERICAGPGGMSMLALSVQVYGRPQMKGRISAQDFYPKPAVDSSIVRVDLYSTPLIPDNQREVFFHLAQSGFGQRRKTLRNALAAGLGWPKERVESLCMQAGIDPQRRAETLSIDEWISLTDSAGRF